MNDSGCHLKTGHSIFLYTILTIAPVPSVKTKRTREIYPRIPLLQIFHLACNGASRCVFLYFVRLPQKVFFCDAVV